MKRIIFTLALLSLLAGCGKDGATGPQGIPGKDGAVIHNGNGAPTGTLGNIGDMYLDKTASNLYGPKTTEGWGTPLSLKGERGATGATGATGAAGSRIFSGAANPATSIGVAGDYYLNTTSGDFLGPKTATGWGTAINLKDTANVVASTWMTWQKWSALSLARCQSQYHIPAPMLNAIGGYTTLTDMLNAGEVLLVYIANSNVSISYPLPHTNLQEYTTGRQLSATAGSLNQQDWN